MTFFTTFTSNTVAGSGNQLTFSMDRDTIRTGRVFYKITHGGEYRYSLLFSNTVDSTYGDGSLCCKNTACPPWEILEARVARFGREAVPLDFTEGVLPDQPCDFITLTFGGASRKTVAAGELFYSDPVPLRFEADEYLCLELTFTGDTLPYHEESLLPIFTKTADGWQYDRKMPLASMIGCDRPVTARIGFVGDSITQGIGTPLNAYTHWNALLARKLGNSYAYWNLGLGFGRANDLASDGAWAYKAKQNDVVIVCYGVNDMHKGFTTEDTIRDLTTIVDLLRKNGCKILLQTIPPFDYTEEIAKRWHTINTYIRTELAERVDLVFDTVPILGLNEAEPHRAKFGGHPNEEGCRLWAEALYTAIIKDVL